MKATRLLKEKVLVLVVMHGEKTADGSRLNSWGLETGWNPSFIDMVIDHPDKMVPEAGDAEGQGTTYSKDKRADQAAP